jgi:hypothetical protein
METAMKRSTRRARPWQACALAGIAAFGVGGPAAAQQGTAPTYISSMSDYQTRALSGSFAPTNGTSSMESITPSEWLNNDPSTLGLSGVIRAWSGGAKGEGSRLFVHGGGHQDGANNGMYTFDFSGTARPTGWTTPLVISPVSAVRANQTYADGKPVSVHTYDGIVYAHHNNHIYRFGGSQWSSGGFTKDAWKFNVATNTWTALPDNPAAGNGGTVTIYDPITGKIFLANGGGALSGVFFRTENDSYSAAKNFSGSGLSYDSMGAWDSSRNRGIVVGAGRNYVVTLNFNTETVSFATLSASGASSILGGAGISAVYDSHRDVYWIFGGSNSSSGWTTLYELNANGSPWTMQAHQLSGDAITREANTIGSWGRFVLMEQWRALGVIASHRSPAYVIKLPEGQAPPTPNPPTALLVN